jgi:hypothetical protein
MMKILSRRVLVVALMECSPSGMFSTIDFQAKRFVGLSVTTEAGETLAVPYRQQVDRARLLPWALATAALAADPVRQVWDRSGNQPPGGSSGSIAAPGEPGCRGTWPGA